MSKKVTNKVLENLKSTSREKMEKAFNLIFNEYSYLVYYVSFKIVRSKVDAEDITNETFLRFYKEKAKVHYAKNIKYYLLTISKNLSLNLVDKRSKEELCQEDKFVDTVKQDYFNDYIEKFKNFLKEEEIDIVVYHILYGFKFKEIALMQNVSTYSISSKYKRIIDKIKKHYKESDFYEKD